MKILPKDEFINFTSGILNCETSTYLRFLETPISKKWAEGNIIDFNVLSLTPLVVIYKGFTIRFVPIRRVFSIGEVVDMLYKNNDSPNEIRYLELKTPCLTP